MADKRARSKGLSASPSRSKTGLTEKQLQTLFGRPAKPVLPPVAKPPLPRT